MPSARITPGRVTALPTRLPGIGSRPLEHSPTLAPLRPTGTTIAPALLRRRASSSYDAGSNGRRMLDWNSTRVGQNTLLINNSLQIVARSREMVRNNAWAKSCVDKHESNVIGTGIKPHWIHPDPAIRLQIQTAWDRWCKKADYNQQCDFYTIQAVCAREIFEGGEVFVRDRLRPVSERLYIPYVLQVIEAEQLPVFMNMPMPHMYQSNNVRMGIEFDNDHRRLNYIFYGEHPGDSTLYPADSLRYVTIPADQVHHAYKDLRAGQLRGEPWMTSFLLLLYELDQYEDASVVKKKAAAMLAVLLRQISPDLDLMPPDPLGSGSPLAQDPNNPSPGGVYPDVGTDIGKLESGTMFRLNPGEDVSVVQGGNETDFESFVTSMLHKIAAGSGLSYEQLTTDASKINYSSIRATIIEVRKMIEQQQRQVIIHKICEPVMHRWLDEAHLADRLDLPNYAKDPWPYRDVVWVPPGQAWVDPLKESQAAMNDVRCGFTSRTLICRQRGYDPDMIDAQQAEERKRAETLGITYDSDPNKILIGRESQPQLMESADPDEEANDVAGGVPKRKKPAPTRQLSPAPGKVPSKAPLPPAPEKPKSRPKTSPDLPPSSIAPRRPRRPN